MIVFIIGCVLGSFIAAASYRIPLGQSLVKPRSRCPHCEHTLQVADLIPIFSFILRRGRCAYCGERISKRYLFIEISSGTLMLIFSWRYGVGWQFLLLVTMALWALLLAAIDLQWQRLPNVLTVAGMGFGLTLNTIWYFARLKKIAGPFEYGTGLLHRWGWGMLSPHFSPWHSLAGIAAGGGILWLLAVLWRGGMGGGDIKFLAAIGSFMGPGAVFSVLFLGSLCGSLVSLPFLISGRWQRGHAVPFGPFLALGAVVAALIGP